MLFGVLRSAVAISWALLPLPISGQTAPEPYFPGPVHVTTQGADAVEVLPQGATWTGLPDAHYVAVTPDGRRVLVTGQHTGKVHVLDARTGEPLAVLSIGDVAQGVKAGPRGRWALAIDPEEGTASAIDLGRLEVAATIHVGKTPHNARFTASGDTAYVALRGHGAIAVIDMKSLKKVGEIPTPGMDVPHNLDLSADGRYLWIRGFQGRVAVLDLRTREILHVIEVGPAHGGIDVAPGGRYVFTDAIGGSTVDVLDSHTFRVVERIEVGQGPHGVRASGDGRWVCVTLTGADEVAVIDTRTLEVVSEIPTKGGFPFWAAVPGNE